MPDRTTPRRAATALPRRAVPCLDPPRPASTCHNCHAWPHPAFPSRALTASPHQALITSPILTQPRPALAALPCRPHLTCPRLASTGLNLPYLITAHRYCYSFVTTSNRPNIPSFSGRHSPTPTPYPAALSMLTIWSNETTDAL